MKSAHRIFLKPVSVCDTLFRGKRSLASVPKVFSLFPLNIRKPQPMLSVFQLGKKLSMTSKSCVKLPTLLTVSTQRASQAVCFRESTPPNETYRQSLLPLPFLSGSLYQQLFAPLETLSTPGTVSFFQDSLVYSTDHAPNVDVYSFSEVSCTRLTDASGEFVTSMAIKRSLLFSEESKCKQGYLCMNRNARHPKRANHGKRPCSRQHRRARRRRFGNHRR